MNFVLAADCRGDAGSFPTQGQQAAGCKTEKRSPSAPRLIYHRASNGKTPLESHATTENVTLHINDAVTSQSSSTRSLWSIYYMRHSKDSNPAPKLCVFVPLGR